MLALLSNLLPSSPDKKGLQQNVNVDYTLADFDTRQAVLVNYNNGTTKKEDLIQQIRKLAEIVVFSEQRHNQAVIDRFFEKSSIGILKNICLDPATSVEVQVQILQTISILIQSVREDMNVYQILSQNHVNLVIAHTFPFATAPEELLAHYISLLKTLAIRMDNEMCQLFFDSSKHGFPLYDSAMLLFANDESLVRAAVRSVVLMVRRITDEAVRQYVDSRQDYVIRMLQFLTHRQEKLLLLLKEQVNDYAWMVKLQGLMSDLLDDFVFLEDILAMRRSSQDLASEVFNSMVIEHMVDPLVNRTFHLNSNNREVALSIWLLCQFCYVIKEPLLLQHIFQSIFVTGGGYQLMLHVDDRICLAISCLAFMLVDHPALVVLKGGFQSRKSFPIIIDSQLLLANPSNSSVPSLNFDQDVLHRQREKDLNSSIDIGNELDAKREENKTKNPTPTIIEGDDESSVNVVEPSDAEVLANATLATAVRSEEKTKKKKKKKGQIVKREEQQQEEALPTTNLKEDQKEEDEEEVAVYPLQLVEYCLQALISRTDPPPNQPLSRSSTVRLLAKLLVHVTYDSRLLDDNNTKLDNTSSSSFLNTNHSHMLRKAITNSVHRFHNLITKPNTETLSVVETFEDEWRELKSGPLKVPSLLTNPGVLLSPEDEPRDNNEQKLKTLFLNTSPCPCAPSPTGWTSYELWRTSS